MRILFIFCLLVSLQNALQASLYTIENLGSVVPSEWFSSARALNDQGETVGIANNLAGYWDSNGQFQFITESVYQGHSPATGINNSGQIIGAFGSGSVKDAFIYENGSTTLLGQLGGTSSYADDINSNGVVTGSATLSNGQNRAFVWENGTMTNLGTLGGDVSYGYGINDLGQVVGRAAESGTGSTAYIWDSVNGMVALDGHWSSAYDINNQSQVVGLSSTGGMATAVLWENGNRIELGAGLNSRALAINELSQIVGDLNDGQGNYSAFLWQNDQVLDLNNVIDVSGWELQHAYDINESGAIVGVGLYNGVSSAFKLTLAVPEPNSTAILSMAFLSIILLRKRKEAI